ncbi:MAG TPA: hypothetical protein VJH88_05370 [Candidatus Nanoarchaeia archaeon]|nr:hypothetical protein [Candidatus Nanoarchaeia archaeon]
MPRKHTSDKIVCGYCGKEFEYMEVYREHIDTEHWPFNDQPQSGG